MKRMSFRSDGEDDTSRLGHALSRVLPRQAVVGLSGTLGTGKTRLVQAVAEADGVSGDNVLSPTFTICNEYSGRRKINHLDLYRIVDEDELFELGFDEYIQSESLTMIEWADRFHEFLPPHRLDIRIQLCGEREREFQLLAQGADYEAVLDDLHAALAEDP